MLLLSELLNQRPLAIPSGGEDENWNHITLPAAVKAGPVTLETSLALSYK